MKKIMIGSQSEKTIVRKSVPSKLSRSLSSLPFGSLRRLAAPRLAELPPISHKSLQDLQIVTTSTPSSSTDFALEHLDQHSDSEAPGEEAENTALDLDFPEPAEAQSPVHRRAFFPLSARGAAPGDHPAAGLSPLVVPIRTRPRPIDIASDDAPGKAPPALASARSTQAASLSPAAMLELVRGRHKGLGPGPAGAWLTPRDRLAPPSPPPALGPTPRLRPVDAKASPASRTSEGRGGGGVSAAGRATAPTAPHARSEPVSEEGVRSPLSGWTDSAPDL
jgi:hypothetical protein